jgi:dihydrofolate reductase
MRRVRYQVAMSLDGYIAGPNGEADWIGHDPEIDFAALFGQFDTILEGRRTYEAMAAMGSAQMPGMQVYVFSRTLRQEEHPAVTVVAGDPAALVKQLKDRPGKDIWLFGGGELFRGLAGAGLVDTVELAVVPVILGGGIPMMPPPAARMGLSLKGHRVYGRSGIVMLEYDVV